MAATPEVNCGGEIHQEEKKWESIMIQVPGGSSVVMDALCFPSDGGNDRDLTAAEVLSVVEERTGIPADALELSCLKGLPLDHLSRIPCNVINFKATLCGGLAGGKGGFGAMLRALAKQNTGHKTKDFGACRDLNGRRLRHVNNEIKLKQWSQARERKEDAARQGVELDSDDEKEMMATKSGINGWYLGVPSWIEHVKQKETRSQRRKLASKRKWEDEEADVQDANLATRDVRGLVTMVDTLRNSFCVVDNDIYVPYTANTSTEDWAKHLKVNDTLQLKCVLKPHGLNKWYAYRAERINVTESDELNSSSTTQGNGLNKTQWNKCGGDLDDENAAKMNAAVMEGFNKEKKVKQLIQKNIDNDKRAMLPIDLNGKKKGIRWGSGDSWLGLLAGEIDFRGDGVICGISEFGSVCVSGVSLVKGKWYYECELRTQGVMQVGWADHLFKGDSVNGDGVGDDIHSWAYDGCRQLKWNGGESETFGSAWNVGDVVGCLIDLDVGEMTFTLNGNPMPSAFQGLSLSSSSSSSIEEDDSSHHLITPGFYPAAAVEDAEVLVLRVTPSSLKYGPPEGYSPISEAMAVAPPEQIAPQYSAPLAPKFTTMTTKEVVDDVQSKPENEIVSLKTKKKSSKKQQKNKEVDIATVCVPEELCLDSFQNVDELGALGLDRLKSALMFLKVKCGGNLQQRADRLWSLKGVAIEDINPALLASSSSKKQRKQK